MTLRGVARRVGIAAPSIYGHFAGTEEILDAVLAQAFADLDAALDEALSTAAVGDRLEAVCLAYLAFARRWPHRYRVMFGRHRASSPPEPGSAPQPPRPVQELAGARPFERLVRAVAEHRGAAPDAESVRAATALWVALHGYASLRAAVPAFPWPGEDAVLTTLVRRLAPPR